MFRMTNKQRRLIAGIIGGAMVLGVVGGAVISMM